VAGKLTRVDKSENDFYIQEEAAAAAAAAVVVAVVVVNSDVMKEAA